MMRLAEAAAATGADFVGDGSFDAVSTDTRTLRKGNLFVALRGERFDGHAFLATALDSGAAAAMVDTTGAKRAPEGLPLLVVEDTRLALGRLAAYWRRRFTMPLVALTGSSGKTTVKEMLASILREASAVHPTHQDDAVLATRGNLNNDVGMPLMLLELGHRHRYAVVEMGMNHAGEIGYLSKLADPDIALINNAGRAHIEHLGSEEAIARAKGEIFEGLRADGTAIINADERYAPLWRELAGRHARIEFALDQTADVTANYELRGLESDVVLKTPHAKASITLGAPGVHNVRNALAAAAAAVALELPIGVISAGLERYRGVKGRLQRKAGANGAVVIDDTYNANPESARAAIDVLAHSPGRKVLVFGDMGELGPEAPRLHSELGAHAKDAGIDRLLTIGERSALAAEAFGRGASHYERIEHLLEDLKESLDSDATVLVKGSRFMRMERVVEAIAAGDAQ